LPIFKYDLNIHSEKKAAFGQVILLNMFFMVPMGEIVKFWENEAFARKNPKINLF